MKTELAERLKKTAKARRMTAERVAEELGVSPAAVWAWWAGRNEPDLSTLVAYARLVGRSLEYLAVGHDRVAGEPGSFADWVMEWVDRIAMGGDPSEAYDRVTGAPEELSQRERQSLTRRAHAMRRTIEETAGRPWSQLSL